MNRIPSNWIKRERFRIEYLSIGKGEKVLVCVSNIHERNNVCPGQCKSNLFKYQLYMYFHWYLFQSIDDQFKKKNYPNSFESSCAFFIEWVVYLLSIEIIRVFSSAYICMFRRAPMFLQPYQAGRYNTYPLQTAEIL